MNKFTTLQHLLESGFDIGLDQYPIFDEAYRQELNDKIIDEFFLREINGTADAFKFYINRAMNKIMPYYNKLYLSELLDIDPLITIKLSEERIRNNTKTGTQVKDEDQTTVQDLDNVTSVVSATDLTTDDTRATTNVINQVTDSDISVDTTINKVDSNDTLSIGSKTPQTNLLVGDITTNVYADEATKEEKGLVSDTTEGVVNKEDVTTDKTETVNTTGNITSDTDSTTDSTSNTDNSTVFANDVTVTNDETENSTDTFTREGYTGSQSELLMKFRETLLNIDLMILEDKFITDCFMQVYF